MTSFMTQEDNGGATAALVTPAVAALCDRMAAAARYLSTQARGLNGVEVARGEESLEECPPL
jgi:hypothetical protein